jgi:REP element-mobilizing transposase RayT
MARQNRRDAIDESTLGVYHCINRCVRRAFLCGEDPVSGNNFDHRKDWIQRRLEFLAGQFAIDVLGFSVMSNHFHTILRNRPDVVASWSDSEVASRWWNLFPARRDSDGSPAKPRRADLKALVSQIKKLRRRLSSISWLMRCLCENVARRANKEDDSSGRFWQGRYKSQKLLDETSILACAIYVDLNPIRAMVTTTPEESRFTSAYQRIQARHQRARRRSGSPDAFAGDGWLSPIDLQDEERSLASQQSRRASDRGFLPLKLDEYLQLLDWTGRQVRADRRGTIPAHLAPILARLQVSASCWVDVVTGFGRWFARAVGRPPSMEAECERCGRNWLQGISRARQAFA